MLDLRRKETDAALGSSYRARDDQQINEKEDHAMQDTLANRIRCNFRLYLQNNVICLTSDCVLGDPDEIAAV